MAEDNGRAFDRKARSARRFEYLSVQIVRLASLAPDLAMASTATTDRSAPARAAAASHQADEAIAPT